MSLYGLELASLATGAGRPALQTVSSLGVEENCAQHSSRLRCVIALTFAKNKTFCQNRTAEVNIRVVRLILRGEHSNSAKKKKEIMSAHRRGRVNENTSKAQAASNRGMISGRRRQGSCRACVSVNK